MLSIVVVEDESSFQVKIKSVIRKAAYNILDQIDIQTFKAYNPELKKRIDDQSKRTLYILDIELKNSISGIEIASIIREKDWSSEIIFLTSHDKMFEQVYRNVLKVFKFIEKFHKMEQQLKKAIRTIINTKEDNKMFKYNAQSINLQIYLKDILYIYRDKNIRKLVIKTTNNEFQINMTLTDIIDELDERFVCCHRACIINRDRVTVFNWHDGYFVLDTGEIVDLLSKKYKSRVLVNGTN